MGKPAPEGWLIDAARARSKEFAGQLRRIDDSTTPVPGLEWTVADLGQHVACLPGFWQAQHESGDRFDRPTDFAAFSNEARAHLTETDPQVLASMVEDAFDGLANDLTGSAEQRWLYGLKTNASNMCGLALNECVLHGGDLAKITGLVQRDFDRREANAAVDGVMATTAAFIDAHKASAQPDGVYGVKFRGGRDYTWTKRGGELVIEPGRPERADARVNVDPITFLHTSLGRMSDIRAGLSGGIVAYGRRPWRFLGLTKMIIDGV